MYIYYHKKSSHRNPWESDDALIKKKKKKLLKITRITALCLYAFLVEANKHSKVTLYSVRLIGQLRQ